MRRNREQRARIRLIQEAEMDKRGQELLDAIHAETGESYAGIYHRYRSGGGGLMWSFLYLRRQIARFDREYDRRMVNIRGVVHSLARTFGQEIFIVALDRVRGMWPTVSVREAQESDPVPEKTV